MLWFLRNVLGGMVVIAVCVCVCMVCKFVEFIEVYENGLEKIAVYLSYTIEQSPEWQQNEWFRTMAEVISSYFQNN